MHINRHVNTFVLSDKRWHISTCKHDVQQSCRCLSLHLTLVKSKWHVLEKLWVLWAGWGSCTLSVSIYFSLQPPNVSNQGANSHYRGCWPISHWVFFMAIPLKLSLCLFFCDLVSLFLSLRGREWEFSLRKETEIYISRECTSWHTMVVNTQTPLYLPQLYAKDRNIYQLYLL